MQHLCCTAADSDDDSVLGPPSRAAPAAGGAGGASEDGDAAEGPISDVDRSCRDLFWLVVAVAFAAGGAALGILGFKRGRLETLVYGVDYSGQVCRSGEARCGRCGRCGAARARKP
jgi:hypothetical protein